MWTWQPGFAAVVGTLIFAVLFVPTLVVQYRRYGRPSATRVLVTAAACVYAVALVAYTLLPLPAGDLATWCATHAVGHNLDPLAMIRDVRDAGSGLGTLRTFAFWQVVFNVVLFVPWGVFGRAFVGWGVRRTTASGLITSLLIETTQATGVFGLIGCAYRMGDVDDVILNTTGALLGALVAPVVTRWLPRGAALASTRLEPRPVTVWRRWTGMLVDASLATVTGFSLAVVWRVVHRAVTGTYPTDDDVVQSVLSSVLPLVVVFVLPACVGDGASWGQRTVWLGPRWTAPDGRLVTGGLLRRLARAGYVGGAWAALGVVGDWPGVPAGLARAADLAAWLLVAVAVLSVPGTRQHRGLSGVLTGSVLADVRRAAVAVPSRGVLG